MADMREDPEVTALNQRLIADPRHMPSLLAMAELKARHGDDRAAQSFYQTALNTATQPGARVDPALFPRLRQGEVFIAAAARRFADHLERGIAEAGLANGAAGARVRAALDLLLGRSEVYLQQPSMFYFPGLAQRAFFERAEFDWLPALEAETEAIRGELLTTMQSGGFDPYVDRTPGRPAPANPLLGDPSWGARYLYRSGLPVEPNCPATLAALRHAPMPEIAGRSPTALFSLLKPGTHIRPHHGLLNTRLICHLPLIAPPGCALRVGAETREWRAGETLIFDDSFQHEAWNRGTETRVVLLFEIWRPELSADERVALTRMFETIDSYRGVTTDQG
ncbi:aspartyl/asparaginyl beta-hydroxylase domain-containing protein [Sphingomonas immobilis]|uniref:Aspartyl/asparaginyl beta-hydroxylase domain-containing protein n=1 Tax=Sphingomonas immobilis TaxID=3063997 RepID=A0ABT8ZVH5_9SPHN|nr:aspartyl/asparaginyl beta-hydroxylase domain-containing protein [Sphingomonas sp. CA1-15]MDO7841583.1 aspartyl/asparaginyl beta-hydroxylase domain-containing protein [Sphingomonas sp. CA1-15]